MVKQQWIDLILDGKKTWEIRGQRCLKRGLVHLALSGTNSILGSIRIEGCRKLARCCFNKHFMKHRVPNLRDVRYATIYAWEMTEPQRFEPPLHYKPHRGAVIWTQL